MAFAWDEGFHILTAQLIRHGKRPYLDFVFSQVPLNAYWDAGWMSIFGETWRIPHAAAALCSAAAVLLTADFVRSRFPDSAWRMAGAIAAALLAGLNVLVVRFGSIAQAYGLCMLGVVSAYRLAVASVRHETARWAAGAGLLWGVALFSSLLTAPVGPVLLLWILMNNRAGSRWRKAIAFLLGALIPSIPVLLLFARGPSQVFFGAVQYNLVHRLTDWPGATRQNLEVLASWINSGSALLLILLAACGLLFIRFRSRWDAAVKAEFYLCAWLSVAIAAYLFYVRPTFERYFVFAVPFAAILAVAGIYFLTTALYRRDRP